MKATNTISNADRSYLRRPEAAAYLCCSKRHLDQLLADGDLPYYRIGRRIVAIKITDLEAFMEVRRIDVTGRRE